MRLGRLMRPAPAHRMRSRCRTLVARVLVRLAAVVATLAPLAAHAFSGAGGECGEGPLQAAALRGTPADLERALDTSVSAIEKVVDGWSRGIAGLYPGTAEVWLDRKVRRSSREDRRKTFARWWTGCQGAKLLDFAVAGQNMPNVSYLLALGVDPDAVSPQDDTLLMRCPYATPGSSLLHLRSEPPERSRDETAKVLATYTLLIRSGASLDKYNRDGAGPLHRCNDPAIVDLYIRLGANVAVGLDDGTNPARLHDDPTRRVVDYRVRQIIHGSTWAQAHHLAILERVLPLVSEHHVTARTENILAYGCRDASRQAACARLAKLLKVEDPRVFGTGGR